MKSPRKLDRGIELALRNLPGRLSSMKAVFGLTFFLSGSAVLIFILFYYFIFTSVVRSGPGEKDVFYVDGSVAVSGGAPCAQTAPCKMIQEAVDLITAGDGDDVWIRGKDGGGNEIVYTDSAVVEGRDISGSVGSPTVIRWWIEGEPPTVLEGADTPPVDTWEATSITNVPSQRRLHTAVWTGEHMVVWGGSYWDGLTTQYFRSGGIWTPKNGTKYDGSPCTDTGGCWEATNTLDAPLARQFHTAVWTGTHMIIWGGRSELDQLNTGGVWTPLGGARESGSTCGDLQGCWDFMATSQAPKKRMRFTAVWTGTQFVVWGGFDGSNRLRNGGIWTPKGQLECTSTGGCWGGTSVDAPGSGKTPLERDGHTAVWTGEHMVVWGGFNRSGMEQTYYNDGSSWTPQNGTRYNGILCTNNGGCWEATSTTINVPVGRDNHTAVWTGEHMVVWGGYKGTVYLDSGGIWTPKNGTKYDGSPCTDTGGCWEATSIVDAPSPRSDHTAVFAPLPESCNSIMVVWGSNTTDTGGIYGVLGGSTGGRSAVFTIQSPVADVHDIVFRGFFVSSRDLLFIDSASLDTRRITIEKTTVQDACSSPVTLTGANIKNSAINKNTFIGSASDAIHLLANTGSISQNSIRENLLAQNQGDGIELLSLTSLASNEISGNLIVQNSSYGLWFNGGTTADLVSNKVFQNTFDANTLSNISIQGETAPSSGNVLRSNITTNTASIPGILTNIATKIDSRFNYIWNTLAQETVEVADTSICPSGCSYVPVGNPYVTTTLTDPYAYYLSSQVPLVASDIRRIALGNGAGPGPDNVLGTSDDVRLVARSHDNTKDLAIGSEKLGSVNIGFRGGLVINENGDDDCSSAVCALANSLQQAHDHASFGLGDHLNVYTVYDSAGSPDRIYSEAISTSANAPITFTSRGVPGFPIIWHNLSYSLATSTWSKDMDNSSFLARLDAKSLKPSNIEVLANASNNNKFRCVDLKGFFFQGATSTPVTGDTLKMTIPVPYHYHWDCAPYARTIIESPVYDTGYEKGVAYNTITWSGDLNSSYQASVQLRLATSNDSSGPWTYYGWRAGNCNTLESYWFGGPGKVFPIYCEDIHTNQRYFRYQLAMECADTDSLANGCPDDGDAAPRVDEIRVNFSP